LRVTRGEEAEPLPGTHAIGIDTRPTVVEDRSEHGVPRLPGDRA
jgi:HemY protein